MSGLACQPYRKRRTCKTWCPPIPRTPKPVYPFISTTVLNYSFVYMRFTIIFDPVNPQNNRSAWLNPNNAALGEPVQVTLEQVCQPYYSARIQTMTTLVALPVASTVPTVYTVTNPISSTDFDFGCALGDDSQTLVYSTANTCVVGSPPGAPSDSNFVLTNTNFGASLLTTGARNTTVSYGGSALKAFPTLTDGLFNLAWTAPASTDGYPIQFTTLVYPGCQPPCPGDDPTLC